MSAPFQLFPCLGAPEPLEDRWLGSRRSVTGGSNRRGRTRAPTASGSKKAARAGEVVCEVELVTRGRTLAPVAALVAAPTPFTR